MSSEPLGRTVITIFRELLQEVTQLTYEEAQTPKASQLARRIRDAIVKRFGADHLYARELGPIYFYHSSARKRNRPKYFEQDKHRAIGVLRRILDDMLLGQDFASTTSDYRLEISPLFGEPLAEDQEKWADVFVLMPFKPEFHAIYQDHILGVVEQLGLNCKRGDTFFSTNIIMQEIWSSIFYAQVCVADCTGKNPNVFYEIGIAHTLGRDCILITQTIDDVPFDVSHYRVIRYDPNVDGLLKLEAELKWTIEAVIRNKRKSK